MRDSFIYFLIPLICGIAIGSIVGFALPSANPLTCSDPQIQRVDIRYFFQENSNKTTRYTTVIECNGGRMTYTLDTDKPLKEVLQK